MSREILVSARAKRDLVTIQDHTLIEFGPDAWAAYKALLDRAFLDLATDADIAGVTDLSEIR